MSHADRPWLLALSGAEEDVLAADAAKLAAVLEQQPRIGLGEVARALAERPPLAYRMAVVTSRIDELVGALRGEREDLVLRGRAEGRRSVVLMFPGVGEHYQGAAGELYRQYPQFREAFDVCADRVEATDSVDLRSYLEPSATPSPDRTGTGGGGRIDLAALVRPVSLTEVDRPRVAQPLLFAIGYAQARLLAAMGLRPDALLGYSVGEYVAACLAGVFQPADAAALVARRAALVERTGPGAMAAVLLSGAELDRAVAAVADPGLVIAARDAGRLSVVAGPPAAVDALARRLEADGLAARRLPVGHAFHSPAMAPVARAIEPLVAAARPARPEIPMLSNVTGGWLTGDEAATAGYWASQVQLPIRFADNLAHAWALPGPILVEAGPGSALTTLARQHPARPPGGVAVATMAGRYRPAADRHALLAGLARAWVSGASVDLAQLV